jgi:hypothetical protein
VMKIRGALQGLKRASRVAQHEVDGVTYWKLP